MEANRIIKNDIAVYKKCMNKIDFMHQFIEDSEIFNPDSPKFISFLTQSFAYLQPDFHYLSFLGSEDINKELVVASEILQILPVNILNKSEKLFGNMNEAEVFQFWMRFFTLFNMKKDFSMNSVLESSWKSRTDFFKNIQGTLHYLNYNLPVVNLKKVEKIDLNTEIQNWEKIIVNEDTNISLNSSCFEVEEVHDVVFNKLFKEVRDVSKLYQNVCPTEQQIKINHFNSFSNFINLTKTIMCYKNNLSIIDSSLFDLYKILLHKEESNLTGNVCFIKKCNDILKTLKFKLQN